MRGRRIRTGVRPLELVPAHPFRISRSEHAVYERRVVRLEHEGETGWGEAAPSSRYGESPSTVDAALEELAGTLGDDPYAIQAIEARWSPLRESASAKAALSMALHDLIGRRHGLPLYRWLGLDLERVPPTSFTIGIGTSGETRRKVEEAAGCPILKVKMGFEDDVETLRAVRDLTGKPIRVDANEGWSREGALDRLPALEEAGVELLEQPVAAADVEGLARIAAATSIPVFADESCRTRADLPGLVGVVEGINVKLAKCGSIVEAATLMRAARAFGLEVLLGCMVESSLGIAAAAHLAPLADHADLDGHLLLAEDPFAGPRLVEGRVLPAPDAPGLGARPRGGEDHGTAFATI
ncbi:MAG: dipeptide epimerase [Gemmatimonadota bacterium]|nr:dipeptide epimerase [Gemmatimonadota bacterium]